jgi:hypothetical protein
MYKITSLLSLLILAGCVAAPPNSASLSNQRFNSTLYITAKNKMGLAGDILSVDGISLVTGARVAAIQPGIRVVAFNCPDILTVGKPATISAEFRANQDYEIICEGINARVVPR